MTSILPPFPRFVFTIFEPLSLILGYSCTLDPAAFASGQLPHLAPAPLSPASHLLALQLANMYGLTALIGIAVLYTTTDPKVVRNFLIACAIADIGHLAVTYHVMGYEAFTDVSGWNAVVWGNVGATAALFFTRVAYLGDFF